MLGGKLPHLMPVAPVFPRSWQMICTQPCFRFSVAKIVKNGKECSRSTQTLKALIKTAVDDTLKYFYLFFFSKKINLDISC